MPTSQTNANQENHAQQDQSLDSLVDPALMGSPNMSRNVDGNHHPPNVFGSQQLDPSWGYDLNLLSHAASHVASNTQAQPSDGSQHPQMHQHPGAAGFNQDPRLEGFHNPNAANIFEPPDVTDPMQDFTGFLDSVGLSSDLYHHNIFASTTSQGQLSSPNLRFEFPSLPNTQSLDGSGDHHSSADQLDPALSQLDANRLPSLPPEESKDELMKDQTVEDIMDLKTKNFGDIADADREQFISKLEEFVTVLPKDFVAPATHTLSRYLAGFITGFHEHLPFMHIPTLNVANLAPELVLALAAVGAQYRFENARGVELFYAAKAVVMEQIQRRDGTPLKHDDLHRSDSISDSPESKWRAIAQAAGSYNKPSTSIYSASDSDARMDIIRALLLLTAFATWERHRELLREALAFQSLLARLVREAGLSDTAPQATADGLAWEQWIKLEGDRRTKLIVYCFFNMHSITWNVPPMILNNEVRLDLPEPADEWKAQTAEEWQLLHASNSSTAVSFQDAFARLFAKSDVNSDPIITPLGNYVLIHALIQQIFFARQLSTTWPGAFGTSIRPDDMDALESALASWKAHWKRTPESSLDPQNPNGPVAFTSTALLGLAYIRLHIDLGPARQLESRDPVQIASALHATPRLQRSPRLLTALLHSAHALSIPIRLGVDFVAKSQTFFWSIQHTICSLECAFLLSKWLAAIPASIAQGEPGLSEHERKLLYWVKSMLDETDSAIGFKSEGEPMGKIQPPLENDAAKMKELSIAVIRVWARSFKGNSSWAIVDLIGSSLEVYGDMLETDPI
ncbi:putative c2h2 transcription factor [Phaeomoniella chlamydospora]|uniref:Putative c2h2 transcription factor n=1 Tax=Phaeomoniella chlamydospora TaxID=158046 RepID=A0A0G2GM16_PHACM|nr:putative c2h2 transcription factor [Phaeomoniella chlamydospora]